MNTPTKLPASPAIPTAELEVVKFTGTVAPAVLDKFNLQWAKLLQKAFKDADAVFQHGVSKAISCGALLNHIKEEGKRTGIVPHGEFGPWIEKHFPGLNFRTGQRWMGLSDEFLSSFQKRQNVVFGSFELYRSLSQPLKKLTPELRVLRDETFDLIAGKSQRQLLLELRNPDFKAAGGKKKTVTPAEALSAKTKQAHSIWHTVESDLQTGCKVLKRIEHKEDLQRILDALVSAANEVRELIKTRSSRTATK